MAHTWKGFDQRKFSVLVYVLARGTHPKFYACNLIAYELHRMIMFECGTMKALSTTINEFFTSYILKLFKFNLDLF